MWLQYAVLMNIFIHILDCYLKLQFLTVENAWLLKTEKCESVLSRSCIFAHHWLTVIQDILDSSLILKESFTKSFQTW